MAGFSFTEDTKKAYTSIFSLRIDEGKALTSKALELDSENGIALYLENMAEILPILIEDNKAGYDAAKERGESRLERLEEIDPSSPYHRFTRAEVHLHWAMVKLNFDEKVGAFFHFRQAYKLLKENAKLHPEFIPTYKPLGILNVMLGSVPDELLWVTKTVGLRGSLELGIKQLELVARSEEPFATEAQVYSLLVHHYLMDKEDSTLQLMDQLHEENRKNLLTHFAYASMLFKSGANNKALQVLKYRPNSTQYTPFHFLNYLLGEAYLQKLEYKQAILQYAVFLKQYKGKNFIRAAYFKLYEAYWLLDEKDKAKTYLEAILKNGQKLTTPDAYATSFAENPEVVPTVLMKCRLLTDGGYYERALALLNTQTMSSFHTHGSQVEYLYRKARLYHKLEKLAAAEKFYLLTMNLTKAEDTYYFAPNASLQLAFLYLEQGKENKAKTHFEKVLTYKKHPYKTELDQAAKSEIQLLEEEGY